MALSLVTRGIICRQSPAIALISWGVICRFAPSLSEGAVLFDVDEAVQCGQLIYTKEDPTPIGTKQVGLFSIPGVVLTGRKSPLMGSRLFSGKSLFDKKGCSDLDDN